MTGAVPGHVVEVDGFDVVLVVVAAEFKSGIGSRLSDAVGGNVIQRAGERIGRVLDLERCKAGQETGRALSMRVGPVLKDAIQAGDQRNLVLHLVQRGQRRRERQRMAARRNGLAVETPDVVLAGELWQRPVALAGEEASSSDPVREIKEGETLCRSGDLAAVLGTAMVGEALEPGQAQRGTAGACEKATPGNGVGVVLVGHVVGLLIRPAGTGPVFSCCCRSVCVLVKERFAHCDTLEHGTHLVFAGHRLGGHGVQCE